MNDFEFDLRKTPYYFWVGLIAIILIVGLCVFGSRRAAAEDFNLATTEDTTSSSQVEDSSVTQKDDQIVIVQNATVDPEFEINNDTQLYSPSTQRATYTAAYDVTTSDSYASMLYDVFLNQGNVYDDFIIYRSGDYQYVLIYGTIKDDLSFEGADVVTLNYASYSQSGKRYNYSYSSDVDGSFSDAGYDFISNIKVANALTFHNYFVRKELHACRIALYILAVLSIFNIFKFFRGGLKSI